MKKIFQKTLILVFEVIMQPPKHTFEIEIFFVHFLAHCALLSSCFVVNYALKALAAFVSVSGLPSSG